ncbi:Aldo/keto reductase family [Teratosphaeria destructans]|uniref:Aldo/keto reductase family n=1 Tax=Teratosphaeria destructans TaxID=418781 RepID=A0A9W7SWF1_9PEZI|nr:Aldo/keto reductase family [Teratosphaeria destructans]
MTTLTISGLPIPRLAFGLGSLMTWAPNHTHPLPTDCRAAVHQALAAGFRHINTGDLYTTNASAAAVLRSSGRVFVSLKLNTYASLGGTGREQMLESVGAEVQRWGGVDAVLLHFPPRGFAGQMSNREAWRVLEGLKGRGVVGVIGVSNWTLEDYRDIMDAEDLEFPPQLHEYEFNPFLLADPEFQALRAYEREHGIVPMNYGILTAVSGRLPPDNSGAALLAELEHQSQRLQLSPAELLLLWAWHRLDGIVVTTTSRQDRAIRTVQLLSAEGPSIPEDVFDGIEAAARRDGPEGKIFYRHPHMEEARRAAAAGV